MATANPATSLVALSTYPSSDSFYKSVHWTADGTTLITASYDHRISSFLVPQNLLDDRAQPLTLQAQKSIPLAESSNIIASSPYFDVRYPNTDHLLVACRDHPIQLHQALPPASSPDPDGDVNHPSQSTAENGCSIPLASYRLISPTTEAYIPVHSVTWPSPGTHFIVGGRDLIAQFDITRNGDGPSTSIPTIPSRRHIRKGNGIGMRGTVSALAAQATAESAYTGLVAAGTWTRSVGLYDFARGGECVSTWNITAAASSAIMTDPPPHPSPEPACDQPTPGIGGAGINQTIWSPCGRYLLINERQSTGMLIYDVRVTNKILGYLAGRDAFTHQRLSCDVFQGLDAEGGFEVWAGTRNGTVKVWEGVGNTGGCQWPSWDFSAGDNGFSIDNTNMTSPALGSVALHHSGSVVASCSGCWTTPADDDEDGSEMDPNISSSTESSDDSDDDNTNTSSSNRNRCSSRYTGLQPGGRKFAKSSLKLWKIGPVPQVDETDHT